jgi:hypothetical protein
MRFTRYFHGFVPVDDVARELKCFSVDDVDVPSLSAHIRPFALKRQRQASYPFPLELELVNNFGFFGGAEVPEVEGVVGSGRDDGAFVGQELQVEDGAALDIVLHVDVHTRTTQYSKTAVFRADGQQSLNGVKGHGRRLVGESVTKSLGDVEVVCAEVLDDVGHLSILSLLSCLAGGSSLSGSLADGGAEAVENSFESEFFHGCCGDLVGGVTLSL